MTLRPLNPSGVFPPYANLVSLRFYLADPAHDPANVEMLKRRLGDHKAARTVVCAGLLEPGWLIEVEAIAAASSDRDATSDEIR